MELRTFHPEFIGRIRALFQKGIGPDRELPPFLRLPVAVPLAIGSSEVILDRYDLPEDLEDPRCKAVDKALRLYCRSLQYHNAMTSCANRFTIDIRTDAPIADEHRHGSESWIRTILKRRREARAIRAAREADNPPETTQQQPTRSGPHHPAP